MVFILSQGRASLVNTEDIEYISENGGYVTAHLRNSKTERMLGFYEDTDNCEKVMKFLALSLAEANGKKAIIMPSEDIVKNLRQATTTVELAPEIKEILDGLMKGGEGK